jgi:DNA end-binding protein Ku
VRRPPGKRAEGRSARSRAELPGKVTGAFRQTTETSPEVWRGTISFSLVAIPVRLVEAISPGRVSFRMLHREDYAPLVSRMLCPKENRIVPSEEIVRGFEYRPGRYVTMTAAELESVSPERSRTIEVTDFVPVGSVDRVYFDYQYFLRPMRGGEKPYRLLVEVLKRTAKAGVASLILAEREYPVIIRSVGGLLAVNTLHYPEEIAPVPGIAGAAGAGRAAKEKLRRVIARMKKKFDPGKYADERREKIVALLKRKLEGGTPVQAPEVEEGGGRAGSRLAELLEASIRRRRRKA